MATYNFTIRATDNAGAYADRNFSLNVNNTIYDRFVTVSNTGLCRSPDGINWIYESGLTGTGVGYGGGKWLVWSQGSALLRSSSDGTSWSTYTPTLTGYTGTWNGAMHAKYRNGAWTAFMQNSGGLVEEWISADAITWTRGATVGTLTLGSPYNVGDFDWDAAGNQVIYLNLNSTFQIQYRAANALSYTNVTIANATSYYNSNFQYSGNVRYYNGLWIIQPAGTATPLTSVDPAGANWTPRSSFSAQVGLIYLNGRILSAPFQPTVQSSKLNESTNAGRTFAPRTGSTAGQLPGFNNNWMRQPLCYAGGTLIAVGQVGVNTVYRSIDDGLTFNAQAIPGANGNIFAVAARDGIN